ncbi:uncharacterized protein [Fopius arisanus]|uniref:Uncharacterized protein isoform X1 n=2 Tax=Fopius arisanus TaxID=64838 RepID=A0A9R1TEP6_9HYME|nr:PREDICTED: uncharacterized protein LOC105269582 isoform X1 [Fopius arisanus]
MSRPILSRPRTRVYGCNYDKGESYYKPMVDHLDRKYSGRPLFPEARTSLADEIAARRSDIGSRDLAGPRASTYARDLDLEFDTPRPRTQAPTLYEDDEDTVYDIRGQRTNRRNLSDDFASEIAATTRRFKAHAASLSYDSEHYDDLRRSVTDRRQDVMEKVTESAKSALEEADVAFKRRSKLLSDTEGERSAAMTRWSKLADVETETSGAASRARQTKARLNDLESEMEEMAERQAKRERRAAALRAMVNETATADDFVQEAVKSVKCERSEKHVSF